MIDIVRDGVETYELPAGMCLVARPGSPGAFAAVAVRDGAVIYSPSSASGIGASAVAGPFSEPCKLAVEARGMVSVEVVSGPSQALVSEAGNYTTEDYANAGSALLRATEGGLLLPRAHPNYHCHYFGGDFFADEALITDLSGMGNHGTGLASFTGSIGGANAGYLTNGTATNTLWSVPSPNFDFTLDESLLLYWCNKHAVATAATTNILGQVASSGSNNGLRVALNGDGVSTGTAYQTILYGGSGTASGGTNTITGANANALSNILKSVAVFFNGRDKTSTAWLNVTRVRTETSFTQTLSSASMNPIHVGACYPTTTGTAVQTRCLAILKWSAVDELPTLAQLDAAIAKLGRRPQSILLDGDL